jgi:hypothetical protein
MVKRQPYNFALRQFHFIMYSVNKHSRKPWPKEPSIFKNQNSSGLVRKQLNMPRKTLHKILAHEKRNPGGTRKKEEL